MNLRRFTIPRWLALPLALAVLVATVAAAPPTRNRPEFPAWTPFPGLSAEGVVVDRVGRIYVTVRDGNNGVIFRYTRRGEAVVADDQASAPYAICMRRTARLAIHRTNAVRSSSPRIAPGRDAGAAGAASRRISVGASPSIGAGTGHSDCR